MSDIPTDWEASYAEAMEALNGGADIGISDHYNMELTRFIETLPASARSKYTMTTLAAVKSEFTAKEFMWLTPEQRLRYFTHGTIDADIDDSEEWED